MSSFAIVFIGRNEGPRLARGLRSALEHDVPICYVDSASTDDSVSVAQQFGDRVIVEQLPATGPQSASRGRNHGFKVICDRFPEVDYVQFVDGDCALLPGWVERAAAFLDEHEQVGIVAGRLREKERERNVYHRLADMEWDSAPGEVASTGGINMVRKVAFESIGGYDPGVVAGEELEMGTRLRAQGYRIVRLAEDMATHDIDMHSFFQWWQRCVRVGDGVALGVYMQGKENRGQIRALVSALTWGGALPLTAFGFGLPSLGLSFGLFAGYGYLYQKVRRQRIARGDRVDDASLYATAMVVTKVAHTIGVLRFGRRLVRGDPMGAGR